MESVQGGPASNSHAVSGDKSTTDITTPYLPHPMSMVEIDFTMSSFRFRLQCDLDYVDIDTVV